MYMTASWRQALRLALGFALVKLLLQFALTLWSSHQGYSYFRDEFYFLACGRHLAWGYVDQGPIVALQARLTTLLFGDSVFGIRVLSAMAGAVAVALCGLLTCALGGGRAAQALAMLGLLAAPVYIGVDGYLSITSFEPIFWMGCILCLILLVRGGPARSLWLAFSLFAGVGLLNKPSMVFFLAALFTGLLLTRQRRLLWTPWAAVAAGLMLVIVAPNLLWQAHHGWPTWEFLHNGRIENKNRILGPLAFLWAQIGQMHPATALVWVAGLVTVLRGKTLRGYRWIGATYLVFLVLMFALRAKDYYLAPIYPMLLAAGAIAWEHRFARSEAASNRVFAFPVLESVLVLTGLLILPMASPVLRPQTYARYVRALHLQANNTENMKSGILPQFYADRFGWTQLTDIVMHGVRTLPPAERQHVCIFASNYGEAGSLEFLGRRLDPALPPVISGHNNYWLWGMKGCSGDPIIAVVSDTPEELAKKYRSVTVLGRISDPLAMPFEHKNVYLLRGRKADAPVHWGDEKHYI